MAPNNVYFKAARCAVWISLSQLFSFFCHASSNKLSEPERCSWTSPSC